ncbi:MAG: hypothetical protein R2709_14355 [Marmoricola sp.]
MAKTLGLIGFITQKVHVFGVIRGEDIGLCACLDLLDEIRGSAEADFTTTPGFFFKSPSRDLGEGLAERCCRIARR